MSNPPRPQQPNILTIFVRAVIFFIILLPLATSIKIPLFSDKTGIISFSTINKISPYTNYLKIFILLFLPSLLAILSVNYQFNFLKAQWQRIKPKLKFLNAPKLWTVIGVILISSWIVNKSFIYLGFPLEDSFHEGEFLGFLPNFIFLKKPFLNSFMVHGFGINVLPSLVAWHVGDRSSLIALARLFRVIEGLFIYVGCFWIIWEIVSSVKLPIRRQFIFIFACGLFTTFDTVLFEIPKGIHQGRDLFFVWQVALLIRYFRLEITQNSELNKTQKFILPILVGASLPLSLLYVYDRAAYFILLYIFSCALAIFIGKTFSKHWLLRSALGLVASAVAIVIILGFDQTGAILSHLFYWARYGRYMFFLPFPPFNIENTTLWRCLIFDILVKNFAFIYLYWQYKQNTDLRKTCLNNWLIIIILFGSLVYTRITIERSDYGHVAPAALMGMLLFICIGLNLLATSASERLTKFIHASVPKIGVFSLIVILLNPALNPYYAYFIYFDAVKNSYRIPDTQIVTKEYLEAYDRLKPQLDKLSCFFTMTSEGLWYYLVGKPSCTKFGNIYYAQATAAQQEVVSDLDRTKPKIILLSNNMWSNAMDGVPVAASASIVYQYLLSNYKPYALIGSQWFWIQQDRKFTFTKNNQIRNGYVDTQLPEKMSKTNTLVLSGWAILPKQGKPADAVYLSSGSDNKLVAVAKVNDPRPDVSKILSNNNYTQSGWKLVLPTKILPTGDNLLRVWAYDAKSQQLQQLDKNIKIQLVD